MDWADFPYRGQYSGIFTQYLKPLFEEFMSDSDTR